MKSIALEDVNNIILETNIKIIDSMKITNLDDLKLKPLNNYGVYVLNYKNDESYIGMSYISFLKLRLSSYCSEVHYKKLIKSIDVFVTSNYHAPLLEKIMIKKFNPELNTNKFEKVNYDDFDSIETIDKKIEILRKELELIINSDTTKNVNNQSTVSDNRRMKAVPFPPEYWKNQIQIDYLKSKKKIIERFGYY